MTAPSFNDVTNAIRALSMDAVEKAHSGHPGFPMGMASVATVLYENHLKFMASDPHWPDRDRFILSAGHGSMLLYSLLYLTGYPDMTIEDLKNFRQLHSKTAGHPEFGYASGIETTTGPLGQGIANAVGMALAESILRARHGQDVINHHTYALVGDGCLMEGISQEAISFAGHLKLSKLIVLWDDNEITIDGSTSLSTSDNQLERFKASQWNVCRVDGNNREEIDAALTWAKTSDKPVFIACKTIIGYGAPTKAGTSKAHGSPLGAEEVKGARTLLKWSYPPFEIPRPILEKWRSFGRRSQEVYERWQESNAPYQNKPKIDERLPKVLYDFCRNVEKEQPKVATRKSSELVLEKLTMAIPGLLGGSADLTSSNNTKTLTMAPITPDDHRGNYIYYGIREHAMGAMMNGLALHGEFIPYGGTFLTFTDYCRPAIRLSALMQQRVIYVMTHDSIGLGEDGPTHQPIEHLSSLRCIPNIHLFRPADTIETAECWALALASEKTPSILALSRQDLPTIRHASPENLCAKGGYIIQEKKDALLTLIATGSEVSLALKVQETLAQECIATRVVSMPCTDLFDVQSDAYKQQVLGNTMRVFIEAATKDTWYKYARGNNDLIFGIDCFGLSAPGKEVFDYFGFTPEKIAPKIIQHIQRSK